MNYGLQLHRATVCCNFLSMISGFRVQGVQFRLLSDGHEVLRNLCGNRVQGGFKNIIFNSFIDQEF